MELIKFEKVAYRYNGASGCMCGCKGNYKAADAESAKANNISEDGISTRAVKISTSKINEMIKQFGSDIPDGVRLGVDADMAWYDDGVRNTVVYFKKD